MQRVGVNRPLFGSHPWGANAFLANYDERVCDHDPDMARPTRIKNQSWELVYDPSGDFELNRLFTQEDVEIGSQGSCTCWEPNTWFRNVKTGVFLEVRRSPWRFDCLNIVKHVI